MLMEEVLQNLKPGQTVGINPAKARAFYRLSHRLGIRVSIDRKRGTVTRVHGSTVLKCITRRERWGTPNYILEEMEAAVYHLRAARKKLHFPPNRMARELGVLASEYKEMESGKRLIPQWILKRLTQPEKPE